jgi:hypothetical protein
MMIKRIQDSILAPKSSIKKLEPKMGMGSQRNKYLEGSVFGSNQGRSAFGSTRATENSTLRSTSSEDFESLFENTMFESEGGQESTTHQVI